MPKEKFLDLIVSWMDETFESSLELLDDSTADNLITSLSLLVLKERSKKKLGVAADLDFTELNELLYWSTSKKSIDFFSQNQNAFLYVFFFLLECRQMVKDSSQSMWCMNATQKDEALILFCQMHEMYNEFITFAPKECQKTINNEVNQTLKDICI